MSLFIISHNSRLIIWMKILILDFHNSNVSPLNSWDMFRKVLLLKEVLEVIFLLRWLVFKKDLSSNVTGWTCDSLHNRGRILWVWKQLVKNKIICKIRGWNYFCKTTKEISSGKLNERKWVKIKEIIEKKEHHIIIQV